MRFNKFLELSFSTFPHARPTRPAFDFFASEERTLNFRDTQSRCASGIIMKSGQCVNLRNDYNFPGKYQLISGTSIPKFSVKYNIT